MNHQFSTAASSIVQKLLITVGIVGILTAVLIVAKNPNAQEIVVCDTKRNWTIREIQGALTRYYSDHGEYPAAIPHGLGHAKEICRYGFSYADCIDLATLVPHYIDDLPADDAEQDPRFMGFSVYQDVPHVWVTADRIGRRCLHHL